MTLKNRFKRNIFEYVFAVLICVLVLIIILNLWKADLSIPFYYKGDSISTEAFIKGIIDNSSFFVNKYIGMPIGANMKDYPNSDMMHIIIIRIIALATNNYSSTINIYFLLTFPLTTIFALFSLRNLKINYLIALTGSLLYTFLPYHFMRGEDHLFLAAYYLLPIICLICIWILLNENIIFSDKLEKKVKLNIKSNKFIFAIIICLMIGASGIYYAFFSCFFLIISGFYTLFKTRQIKGALNSFILTLIICISVVINVAPSILYIHDQGKNTEFGERSPADAEVFGLKITNLILPTTGHRINILANAKAKYNSASPLVNENDTAALGIIGAIGLVSGIGIALVRIDDKYKLIGDLGLLNICAIFLGTVGGFGSLFAWAINSTIRSYNRISIFIAFFSITTVALILDNFKDKIKISNTKTYLFNSFIIVLALFGIYDQTSPAFIPKYEAIKAEFNSDEEFVKNIEKEVPVNSSIFQMPYISYPENGQVNKMVDYDLFRGYLHSENLKWSYGAMRGREADKWQKKVSQEELIEFVKQISQAGFKGIYIDKFGYKDNDYKEIENELVEALNIKPIYSPNNRLVFLNLKNFNNVVK